MKKIIMTLAVFAALLVAGCAKEHQCKCETAEAGNASQRILTIDGQMKCESITELGVEEKYVTADGVHSLRRTEMQKVNCRPYAQ